MGLFRSRYRFRNFGLLILRIGIGIMFMLHGWPKLIGGPDKWEQVGQTMGLIGIEYFPVFWGFMAAFTEVVGGLLFALGFLFKPVCILLLITMIMATLRHYMGGDAFGGYSHAAEAAILFFSLIFIGPGKYSLDKKVFMKEQPRRLF